MPLERLIQSRWAPPLAGAFLFLAVFLAVFCLTLPKEAILGLVSQRLAKKAIRLEAQDARLLFPIGVEFDNATFMIPTMPDGLSLSNAYVKVDLFWLFRGLPIHLRASRGNGFLDARISGPSLGRGRLSAANLASDELPGILPGNGLGLNIERSEFSWSTPSPGHASGSGQSQFSSIKFPIPAPDSPVREALIRNARMEYTLLGNALHVSSLRGEYEGSPVEGSGEITNIGSPARSAITFLLMVRNPYEGKVASIFNLVSKNAKNVNLRIYGPLLSPAGEFRFF